MDMAINLGNNLINSIKNILDKAQVILISNEELNFIEFKIQQAIFNIKNSFKLINEEFLQKKSGYNKINCIMLEFSKSKIKFSEKQIQYFKNYVKIKEAEEIKVKKHLAKLSNFENYIKIYNNILQGTPKNTIYFNLKNILNIQKNLIKSLKKINLASNMFFDLF